MKGVFRLESSFLQKIDKARGKTPRDSFIQKAIQAYFRHNKRMPKELDIVEIPHVQGTAILHTYIIRKRIQQHGPLDDVTTQDLKQAMDSWFNPDG